MRTHIGGAERLCFSADGSLLACIGEYWRGVVEIWNVRSGDLYCTVHITGRLRSITFSPNGHTVVLGGRFTGSDSCVALWDVRKDVLQKMLGGKGSDVTALAYSQDGSTLVAADMEGIIRVWNPVTGLALHKMGGLRTEVLTAVSSDTHLAAVCSDSGALQIYDTAKSKLKYVLGERSLVAQHEAATKYPLPQPVVETPATPQDSNVRLRRALIINSRLDTPTSITHAVHEIKQALTSGADPNLQTGLGTSALMFFAYVGDLDAVKDLVHRGVKLDLSDDYGHTALLHAVAAQHSEIVQFLLEAGADLKDIHGKSLLPLRGHPDTMGAVMVTALNSPFGMGQWTPDDDAQQETDRRLWQKFDSEDTALLLLQFGALPNVPDKHDNTAIQYADSAAVVQALVAHGADINRSSKHSYPPITWWARRGQIELVRIALDHGANVNITTDNGTTALNYTAQNGRDDITRLLLERHADPNISLEDGRTPLMMAIDAGNLDIVKLLLDHGAQLEPKDDLFGWTALVRAVNREDREEVRLLLAKGADVHVLTKKGIGLLQVLHEIGPEDRYGIVELLKKAGI